MSTQFKRIINLNGTSVDALVEQHQKVHTLLEDAIEALAAASPHGRDFQLNPGDFEGAQKEHYDRLARLTSVKEEIEELHHDLYAQGLNARR